LVRAPFHLELHFPDDSADSGITCRSLAGNVAMKRRFGFKHALRQRIQNNCKRDSDAVIDMNTAIAHTVESALHRNWPWPLKNRRKDAPTSAGAVVRSFF
jgi:hypothetical protein